MTLERLWYESSPYLYGALGIVTAADAANRLMKASGLILLGAALTILGLRWIYRHDEARSRARQLDEKRYVALITQDLFYDGTPTSSRRPGVTKRS